jgi:hypothetical protein
VLSNGYSRTPFFPVCSPSFPNGIDEFRSSFYSPHLHLSLAHRCTKPVTFINELLQTGFINKRDMAPQLASVRILYNVAVLLPQLRIEDTRMAR